MGLSRIQRGIFKFSELYVCLYLFIMLVMSENEALTNYGVVIPFVQFKTSYIRLGIALVGLLCVLLNKSRKYDLITVLLSGRIILSLLNLLVRIVVSQEEIDPSFFGNFVMAVCVPLLIYIFFRNTNIDFARISRVFILFGIIVALQCIWAYITILQKGLATYNAPYYKNYFVIPAGATNNISAILLPLLILGDQIIPKKGRRNCYVMLLLFGIFLCKSRTGMILSVGYLLFKLFIKERGKHNTWKKVVLLFLPVLSMLTLILLYDSDLGNSIRSLMLGYSSSGGGLNSLLSGRFTLFGKVLSLIAEHPWLGNGVTYEKLNFMRPHNIFLQILFENGILGFIGFLIFLIHSVKRTWKLKNHDKWAYTFSVMVPFILINAMFEDTMLTGFMFMFGLLFLAYIEKTTANGGKRNV